jgi:hypothetical protein
VTVVSQSARTRSYSGDTGPASCRSAGSAGRVGKCPHPGSRATLSGARSWFTAARQTAMLGSIGTHRSVPGLVRIAEVGQAIPGPRASLPHQLPGLIQRAAFAPQLVQVHPQARGVLHLLLAVSRLAHQTRRREDHLLMRAHSRAGHHDHRPGRHGPRPPPGTVPPPTAASRFPRASSRHRPRTRPHGPQTDPPRAPSAAPPARTVHLAAGQQRLRPCHRTRLHGRPLPGRAMRNRGSPLGVQEVCDYVCGARRARWFSWLPARAWRPRAAPLRTRPRERSRRCRPGHGSAP